jgi:tRNA-binding protein
LLEINFNWSQKQWLMTISYEDFAKLDLRVAKIESVEAIPGKSRIVKGIVDLGSEKRNVIIGGAEFYKPEDLIGKIVIAVTNLEPKKLAGIVNDKPYWLTVNEDVPTGTKIK